MNYSLKLGIFTPNSDGFWKLTTFSEEKGIGIFESDGYSKSQNGYFIGNGLYSIMSTQPIKGSYLKIIDRYVPDGRGKIKIKGSYPFYRASDGSAVFLDVRRTFTAAVVDFPARVRQYFSDRKSTARKEKIAKQKRRGRFTYRVIYDPEPDSTLYLWTVRFGGKELARGKAETLILSERLAERRIRQERLAMLANVR